MGLMSKCCRFCHYIWSCRSRHEGECQETDDDDFGDVIERTTY